MCLSTVGEGNQPPNRKSTAFQVFVLGGEGYIEKEAVATAWFDLHACSAAIVRPDHYVYCGLRDASLVDQAYHDLQERLRISSR